MNTSIIAANIRAERARRRWTLAELAERSDVSATTLSAIENEHHSPSLRTLTRIAAAMGIALKVLTEPDLIAA